MGDTEGMIHTLPQDIVKKIAAGEVIERPASVVKELIENSIDAGASHIAVSVREGGKRLISVRDDGIGIKSEYVEIAFRPHTTSKIGDVRDLYNIHTLGFRGEALASIAAVSRVEMTTRHASEDIGTEIRLVGGEVTDIKRTGAPVGTSVKVMDLFYNLPARRKFMKGSSWEESRVLEVCVRAALSRPDISFKVTTDRKLAISVPGDGSVMSTASSLFGPVFAQELIPFETNGGSGGIMRIHGLAGRPSLKRHTKSFIYTFINNRPVYSKTLIDAVRDAYANLIPKGYYPACILYLEIEPRYIDVNVHPTKSEVLFKNESDVTEAVQEAVAGVLRGETLDVKVKPKAKPSKLGSKGKETIGAVPFSGPEAVHVDGGAGVSDGGPGIAHVAETLEAFGSSGVGGKVRGIGRLRGVTPDLGMGVHKWFMSLRVLGQISNTYIVCEGPDGMYIIDQHAAHERVMYYMLKHGLAGHGGVKKQKLIEAVSLTLTPRQSSALMGRLGDLKKIGIEAELDDEGRLIVKTVPSIMQYLPSAEDVREIIEETCEDTSVGEDFIERTIRLVACKSAIKANTPLNKREMESLIEQMGTIEDPWACAHGRPTVLRIDVRDMERWFLRS